MALPWFLQYKKSPARDGGVSVSSWTPAPESSGDDLVNLPQTQPAQELNIGPSKDLASAGSAGHAVKMPGPSAWDKTKPYANAALGGLAQGGVGGALSGLAVLGIKNLIKGFADGGDLTPYVGKRVRLGERGPELVVDADGNTQPVGLHGEEEGVPTRPGVVIPHEALSDEAHSLIEQHAGAERAGRLRELAVTSAQTYANDAAKSAAQPDAQTTALRPRRALQLTPDEQRETLPRRSTADPNAPVDPGETPLIAGLSNAPANPDFKPGVTQTRPRWSSELNKETEHNLAERDAVAHPEERHGWKRLLPLIVSGFLSGARGGDPVAGLGGAISGGVTGAVDSRAASRAAHGRALARSDARLTQLRGQRKEDAALAQTEAQTDWLRERPGIERDKATAAQLQRDRSNVLAQIRARKGTPFTPGDPLLTQAGKLGMHFDADSLNNAASNVVQVQLVDPEHPKQIRRATLNKVTGELTDVGQSNYVQPVGADGRTQSQRDSNDDRDRAFTALEHQRSITNELQRAGLNLSRERFDFQRLERDDRFSERSRKEIGDAAKLRSEAEQAEMDARAFANDGMYTGDDGKQHQAKWAVQRYKSAQDKAEALRRQYFQTYGYLHAPDGGEMKMTMDEFRQLFPNAPNLMASAPSYGVVITDSTQPGTPHTNNYPPRRPAPRAPSSAAPSSSAPAQPKGRVSRANFGRVREQNPQLKNASDAEVEAALRAQGIEVY